MDTKDKNLLDVKDGWSKPELLVISVDENTLGLGGGGPDFGSELS